jgi:hypothetical protein
MRLLAALAALATWPLPLNAQSRLGIHGGGAWTSALVRDSITEPLAVRPAPGPGVAFSFDTPLGPGYRLEVRLGTTWSRLVEHTAGESRDIVSLAVWHPAVILTRQVVPGLSARAGLGALVYRPEETTANLFAHGSPIVANLGLGLQAERQVGAGLHLALDLTYDAHRFTTGSLRNQGFTGERVVHRLAVFLGVRRTL